MDDALAHYQFNMDLLQDPFADNPEPILLGQCIYSMEGLAYLMDNPKDMPIIGTDKIVGRMHLNLVPCTQDGNEDLDEDQLPEEPYDLIGESLDFKVKISSIYDLPEDFYGDMYCEYKFYMDEKVYQTPVMKGKDRNPVVNFSKQHHVDCVTQYLIDYLLKN